MTKGKIKRGRKLKERCLSISQNFFCFKPTESSNKDQIVTLFCDELETIRLKNIENLDIFSGGDKMGVSKSTFARIYENAINKVADFLINGKTLVIEKRCYDRK